MMTENAKKKKRWRRRPLEPQLGNEPPHLSERVTEITLAMTVFDTKW